VTGNGVLEFTRAQILAHRRSAGGLDERRPERGGKPKISNVIAQSTSDRRTSL